MKVKAVAIEDWEQIQFLQDDPYSSTSFISFIEFNKRVQIGTNKYWIYGIKVFLRAASAGGAFYVEAILS